MDPTQLLKQQHRDVEELFRKVQRAEDGAMRTKLLDEITQSLELHMRLEEELFYPAMRDLPAKKAEEMVSEAYEEHHVAKLVMAELPELDPEDERFAAKMTVFSELIEHHVEEEEQEMFKLAKKLHKDDLEDLGERMAAVVRQVKGDEALPAPRRRQRART